MHANDTSAETQPSHLASAGYAQLMGRSRFLGMASRMLFIAGDGLAGQGWVLIGAVEIHL